MPNKVRSHPTIPDHDVLRKIGGGAYGEVWLARGVTGALRAVKVVWREDFEDARTFEREFEGILKFEPISRDHPALVNILHVGRSPDGVSFYYYVMELGDDVRAGQDINPIEYEPRTLREDNKAGTRWDTGVCIDVGLRLAEALDHLHERGLAHRDVKPSNIIFVNGRAKLADIGLVAARDQRTFVGTEGFVPPEGPGSAQADVYSLGKVLYEIATGKDRLDFPDLPDELPTGADRKRWLELNKIICDICEPRISRRKISKASDLAECLRLLQRGKRRRQSGSAVWMTSFVLTAFAAWATWQNLKDGEWVKTFGKPTAAEPAVGLLKVTSSPEGAEVFDSNGHLIGMTNTGIIEGRVGDQISLVLKKDGFRPLAINEMLPLSSANEPHIVGGQLQVFAPPEPGKAWEDQLGNLFKPVGADHVSASFVRKSDWMKFIESSARSIKTVEFIKINDRGQQSEIVLSTGEEAVAYCDWLRVGANKGGVLTEDHEALPLQDQSFDDRGMSDRARRDGLRPLRVKVRKISYGSIMLSTNPPGASVTMNGQARGIADGPMLISKVKPGSVELYFALEGFKPLTLDVTVDAGKTLPVQATLEENQGIVFGKPWKNGIEMKFVPLGDDLMVSIWETRLRDYLLFLDRAKRGPVQRPNFSQTPDHPVVYVSRDDAQAFCSWLTKREQDDERIALSHVYRLPTDLEWSRMAGLEEEEGISPGWRDARRPRMFPWGDAWPPPDRAGNFADATAALAPDIPNDRTITYYDDGFAHTAPVGSFPPNTRGIHDLCGNVQEWVSDPYSRVGTSLGVLRGGGWNTYQQENLFTGSRNAVPVTFQDAIYGFRIVLSKIPPTKVADESSGITNTTPATNG